MLVSLEWEQRQKWSECGAVRRIDEVVVRGARVMGFLVGVLMDLVYIFESEGVK